MDELVQFILVSAHRGDQLSSEAAQPDEAAVGEATAIPSVGTSAGPDAVDASEDQLQT